MPVLLLNWLAADGVRAETVPWMSGKLPRASVRPGQTQVPFKLQSGSRIVQGEEKQATKTEKCAAHLCSVPPKGLNSWLVTQSSEATCKSPTSPQVQIPLYRCCLTKYSELTMQASVL